MPKDLSQFHMVVAVVRSEVEIEIVKAPNSNYMQISIDNSKLNKSMLNEISLKS